jgi:UDP:flavonoid glycosyltransferase YjiC (YdhE family)
MHFVLVTIGTRGDAQPFVAVGVRLKERGHHVTVATHEDHRSLVEGAGLTLRPICGNIRELLETPAGRRWFESGDNIFEYGRAFRALFEPLAESWSHAAIDATEGADAVVGHLMATGAWYGAEKRGVPYLLLCPYPSLPSGRIAMAPPGEWPLVGPMINRLGWRIFEKVCWAALDGAAKRVRADLGLPPSPSKNAWVDLRARKTPYLHCYSDLVLPKPPDWPDYAEVTGWCSLEAPANFSPSPALTRFLEGGDALYVGFGSMTGMDQEVLARITVGALRKAKRRAVICSGWGTLGDVVSGDDILCVDDAPHDWLFARVAQVVHHGGAGTFAAGLRAGKPTLVVPFFGDQPMWGRFAARMGVGPAPLPKKKLSEERLAAAITALADPKYAARATEWREKFAAEDGASKTAARIVALSTATSAAPPA